jgi:anti-sigma regulatory factor (Ser/Thr protein kinase)
MRCLQVGVWELPALETVMGTEGGTVSRERTTPVPDADRLVHEAFLYRDEHQLAAVLRAFVADAQEAGEPVLAAVPTHNVAILLQALGPLTRDVYFEDMAVVGRNPNTILSLYQDWIDAHEGRVRVIGEPIWPGRSYPEIVECLRHEALVNWALGDCSASILCPYDTVRLGDTALVGAELTHPSMVIGDGRRRPSSRYGEPIELYAGLYWPQQEPTPPVSEIEFTGDLHMLRTAVASHPAVSVLEPSRVSDLVFAVNEVATNTLRHGDGVCTARVWRDGVTVVVELGCTAVLDEVALGRRRPAPDAHSGRGLWMVNQLCDLVELRPGEGGTTLRLHVRDGLAAGAVGMTPA